MPTLLGTLPEFGIAKPEEGILVESITFDGKLEKYDQKDNMGRKCGVIVVDEELSFSMSGALPAGGDFALKMGASLLLANSIPDIWCTKPKATTTFIENVKRTLGNAAAVKLDITGTVYGFGNEPAPEQPAAINEQNTEPPTETN